MCRSIGVQKKEVRQLEPVCKIVAKSVVPNMVIRTSAASGWVFCLTNRLIWVMSISFEHESSDANSSSDVAVGMSVRRNFVVMFSHRMVADIGVSSS
ncbi:hypothetical protein AVEN_85570-1 [Araneus ventricosus]|uniref:Uncharacterized protein n=1 Tax=Araneus ventricosus TaxID=182803 RepID=A0A4Y2P866_ARAVE|nr:hypothetical protein AVEN_85570-1 [Araneus ventricosus]